MPTLIKDILTWRAKSPSEPAFIQAGKESYSITYLDLQRNIEDFGEQLQNAGIGKGSMICLALPNSPIFAVAFLAAIARGATVAPLNPALKQAEIQFQLNDFEVDLVIGPEYLSIDGSSDLAKATTIAAVASSSCYWDGKRVILDLLQPERKDSLVNADGSSALNCDDNTVLALHTSGTTGRPKGVPLQECNLLASARNVVEAYSLTPNDRSILIMPLFHIHGIVAGLLAPLLSGSCVIFPEKGNLNPAFWEDFMEHKATWWTATPTHQKILLSFPPPPKEVKIRFIRSCSSPLSPVLLRRIEETFHAPVLEAYAMTENAHHISTNPEEGSRKPGTVGLPCKSVDLRIIDDEDRPLDIGEKGEVAIKGPSVMRGYRQNPEANAKAFTSDGYFRTGDQGVLDSDGYLQLTGRIKELVNKGGEKISVNEIDNVILEHRSVSDAVAFAVPDDMYGEDVGAAVVLKGESILTSASLKEWLRVRMANFKVPCKIWIVESIPKTATGKVQRLAVAKAMLEKEDQVVADTADDFTLRKIWSEVLSVDTSRLKDDDDFFALGGDSVAAIRLSNAAKVSGFKLDPATVFRFPIFNEMAMRCVKQEPVVQTHTQAPTTEGVSKDLYTSAAEACGTTAEAIEEVQPLTALQCTITTLNRSHGMWMMVYTFAVEKVTLRELELCIEIIRQRNPILRSRVADINGKLYNVFVNDEASFETSTDIKKYVASVGKMRILYGCPQIKYAIVNDEAQGSYFVFAYSHNVLDAWSRRLFLDEMALCLQDPQSVRKSADPQGYQVFATQVAQAKRHESLSFYLSRLQGCNRSGYLETLPSPVNSRQDTISRHVRLTKSSIKSSNTLAIIHLAYALTLRAMSGDALIWFPTISSGRLAPIDRVETVMGLMIASVPICLDMSSNMTVKQALDELLAQMYGGIQHEPFASEATGEHFGKVLRESFLNCSELDTIEDGYVIEAQGGKGRLRLDATKSLLGGISPLLHMRVARVSDGLKIDATYSVEAFNDLYMEGLVDVFTKFVVALDKTSTGSSLDGVFYHA